MEKLTWKVHRARETPTKTVVVSVLLIAFVLFALWCFGPFLALIAVAVLAIALHTYFLPITYTFSDRGVTVDKRIFSYTYPWEQFRRYFHTTGGLVLSPFSRPNFLDNFRGVHLLLPKEPASILDYLDKHFEQVSNP